MALLRSAQRRPRTCRGGGISVDQVIANQIGAQTKLPSLQVGLSTLDSFCDGTPCAHSRSISWSSPEMMPSARSSTRRSRIRPPRLRGRAIGAGSGDRAPSPILAQTRTLQKSVLDAVLDSATSLRAKLRAGDQTRVDQYLTSVRDLAKLVATPSMQVTGGGRELRGRRAPPEAYADMGTPPDYGQETHANIMIQLS